MPCGSLEHAHGEPDINVIFGINDDSTTGAIAAYRSQGLDEGKLVAIGFGFEGSVGQNALLSGTSYKAALAMFPNFVGVSLIDVAVKVHAGKNYRRTMKHQQWLLPKITSSHSTTK